MVEPTLFLSVRWLWKISYQNSKNLSTTIQTYIRLKSDEISLIYWHPIPKLLICSIFIDFPSQTHISGFDPFISALGSLPVESSIPFWGKPSFLAPPGQFFKSFLLYFIRSLQASGPCCLSLLVLWGKNLFPTLRSKWHVETSFAKAWTYFIPLIFFLWLLLVWKKLIISFLKFSPQGSLNYFILDSCLTDLSYFKWKDTFLTHFNLLPFYI